MLLSTDELRYQHKFRFNPDEKSIFIDWSGRPNDTTISDESCGLWLFVILCMWEPWPTPSPTSCLFHRPHSVFFSFVRKTRKIMLNLQQLYFVCFCCVFVEAIELMTCLWIGVLHQFECIGEAWCAIMSQKLTCNRRESSRVSCWDAAKRANWWGKIMAFAKRNKLKTPSYG